MNLNSLVNYAHSRYLSALSVKRHLEGEDFAKAYDLATKDEKEEIIKLAEQCNAINLVIITKKILKRHNEYHYLDITTLKHMAQEYVIKGYASMDKATLVVALTNYHNRGTNGRINQTS